jgi:hypothetical protein
MLEEKMAASNAKLFLQIEFQSLKERGQPQTGAWRAMRHEHVPLDFIPNRIGGDDPWPLRRKQRRSRLRKPPRRSNFLC